jgi:hypothetical protein
VSNAAVSLQMLEIAELVRAAESLANDLTILCPADGATFGALSKVVSDLHGVAGRLEEEGATLKRTAISEDGAEGEWWLRFEF